MTRALALAALLGLLAGCGSGSSEPDPQPTAPVETTEVSVGAIEETITAFGTVEFDPDRTRVVPFARAGQLVRVAVVAGQPVSKGDLLVEIGATPPASLDARRARIDLEFAERELARMQRLLASQLATNADLDAAAKNVAASRAALESLGGGSVPHGELRATEDSVVVEVMATPGSLVQAGQAALTIAPAGAVVARVGFEPEDMPHLGESAEVRLEPLFGDDRSQPAHGRISHLHQGVNPATQLVELLLRVDQPPPWMVAGAKVRASAVTRRAENAVLVSNDALLEREGRTGAFVVEDGRARWRAVEVGLATDSMAEARSGLHAGEHVVTAGRTILEEGMRVRTPGQPEPE
ncbi:MAG TPA: efflux RND transporter periplasmic adaptor subunit [Myxococcota bacterium]|nr:efflux RND transporter periplasmic adaptor subunit [Myxococcota bacterium]